MVSVRPFEERDAQPLADLMMEMIDFYGATVDPRLVVAEDVVRQSETVDIIVAQGDEGLLGFATFTSLYPVAGLISFTYAQQIYVGAKARRMGVAQRLMAGIARIATARGSTRIEWSTGKENAAAQALYEGLGAVGSDKVQYVLEGTAFDELAARAD
jgi:ribosomal protein S18 acetylase RimI-like enzyme